MLENNIVEKIEIEGRKRLFMSGVDAVDGFTEQNLYLTVNGAKVKVSGQKIKITAYNKASQTLSAEGEFNEIKYNEKKVPLIKKVFK